MVSGSPILTLMISMAWRNVASDLYFAEHDRQQGKRYERDRRNAQKHANHEYGPFQFHE